MANQPNNNLISGLEDYPGGEKQVDQPTNVDDYFNRYDINKRRKGVARKVGRVILWGTMGVATTTATLAVYDSYKDKQKTGAPSYAAPAAPKQEATKRPEVKRQELDIRNTFPARFEFPADTITLNKNEVKIDSKEIKPDMWGYKFIDLDTKKEAFRNLGVHLGSIILKLDSEGNRTVITTIGTQQLMLTATYENGSVKVTGRTM